VILHELLTGGPPPAPGGALVLPPHVPRDLAAICGRCLLVDPAERYPSAAAAADDLGAFLANRPVRAAGSGLSERLKQWFRGQAAAKPRQRSQSARSFARLELLLELTRRLMWSPTLPALLGGLAEMAQWLTGAEWALVYLLDRARGELRAPSVDGDIRLKLGAAIAGNVAVTGQPLNLADPYTDPRFSPDFDERSGLITRNLLALPMVGQTGILGVLEIANKPGPFAADEIDLLSALLASASIAVERAAR
jgi:hypothetical protein